VIVAALLYLWQLPQNLLGLALFSWPGYKPLREIRYRGRRVLICDNFPGGESEGSGISLGNYILVDFNRTCWDSGLPFFMGLKKSVKHEFGHSRQSLFLGWLYLPVVGIPSAIHAAIHNYRARKGLPTGDYHAFWCERWADRLGGVTR
jgi:hypothetical protein